MWFFSMGKEGEGEQSDSFPFSRSTTAQAVISEGVEGV